MLLLLPDPLAAHVKKESRLSCPSHAAGFFFPRGPSKKQTMCVSYYYEQPRCTCIHVLGLVRLCSVFSGLPSNRTKETFNPKLITTRCQGLDLFFDGVNFVSGDVGAKGDIAPNGMDCPELQHCEEKGPVKPCPLCDSPDVIKFLKVKGIEFESLTGGAAHDGRDSAAGRFVENAGEEAGKSVGEFAGESVDGPVDSLAEDGDVVDKGKGAQEKVGTGEVEPKGKRARSRLANQIPASSVGWD